jgi:DNA repair protein SbcC/Rad50
MVPVRVLLENFLTYEEAEFDFRGARLWSIWGDNGAGKSAIFDAITYCLFGVHRGGAAQGADAELLRKGATRMSAVLEVELDGTLHRVTRTLTRRRRRTGASADERTQQADWFDPDDGVWRAVPGTEARAGLAEWVREKLGLGYETFVASVVLLQGQSDRLLQAKPDQRFTILSDLIDLDEYERLEGMARDEARDARVRAVGLENTLEATPAVGDEELAAVEAAFAAAEGEVTAHRERVAQAIRLVDAAHAYWVQAGRADLLRAGLREMEALIAGAHVIRRDATAHRELFAALGPVTEALAALSGAEQASLDARGLEADAAAVDVEAAGAASAGAVEAADEATRALTEAAAAPARLRSERESVAPLVAAAARIEALEASTAAGAEDLTALDAELAALPGVTAALEAARALARAEPLVARLLTERREAAELRSRLDGEEPAPALARAREALERAAADGAAARAAREQAQRRGHERQAAVAVLERTMVERREAGAEGTCSHCGQRVDAAHIAAELRRAGERLAGLREAVAAAEREMDAADRTLDAADTAAEQRRAAVRDLEDVARGVAERERRIEETAAQLLAVVGLPGWAAEAARGPAEGLADRVGAEAARAEAIGRERERLLAVGYRRQALGATVEAQRRELAALLAGSAPEARSAAVARDAEVAALIPDADRLADEARQRWEARRREAENLRLAFEAARTRHAELSAGARAREAEAAGLRREAAMRLEPVPAGWRERALARDPALAWELRDRLAELADAPARAADLERAERDLGARRDLLRELEEALERTPPTHRVPVDDAERIHAELDARTPGRQQARDAALHERDRARRLREERRELEARVQQASRTRRQWERLTRLLGRGGLQARLMDDALAGIQQLANETLRQISNGQLEVRLAWNERGERQEIRIQAVDLASSEEAMDVAFVSGGQKFRVAVALAAGIGRYAGGTLRSLVIDEGFGSLDQQGRHQVIEQLRAIASVMDRVIVVSHQEDFQDRRLFPAGYVLRKDGRRTTVTRAI